MRLFNRKKWVFLAAGIALCLSCAGTKPKPSEQSGDDVTEAVTDDLPEEEFEPDDTPDAWCYVRSANSHLQSEDKNIYSAIQDASEAIRLDPDGYAAATAYVLRARAHSDENNHYQTIHDASEAIRLSPDGINAPVAYILRAEARLNKNIKEDGDVDLVIEDCDSAIQLDARHVRPSTEAAYFLRSVAHSRKKNYDQAVADSDTAIQMNIRLAFDSCCGRYLSRAEAHFGKKNYDLAIEDASAEIQKFPDGDNVWDARRLRAKAYSEKGDYNRAVKELSEAIQMNPNDAGLYNSRAWTYAHYMKKNFDRAIEDADRAIELDPNSGTYYDTRGWAYFGKGDYDSAERDFSKALQLDPSVEESKEGMEKVREARAAKKTAKPGK